jgi:two-component system alkaline phosphatase synthesis response regulator PhoP
MMPGKSGFQVMMDLNKSELTKSIPVVMLTAKSSTYDIKKANDLGAKGYIRKPIIENQTLIDKVNEVLNT